MNVHVSFYDQGTETGSCGKTVICTAIKALETKQENLFAMVIILSASPPPIGKLGVTDLP